MTELQKNKKKNCLVGEGVQTDEESLDLKMLLYNKLPGYLPLQIQYIDNQRVYLYALDGMVCLSDLLTEKRVGAELIQKIYFGISESIRTGREYLLDLTHLILNPEYIYWDSHAQRTAVCYFPEYQMELDEQWEQLNQYFLRVIDHSDRNCVALVYGLYDFMAKNGFQEYQLERYLQEYQGKEMEMEIEVQEQEHRGDGKDGDGKHQSGKADSHESEGGTHGLRCISGERGIPKWIAVSEKGVTVGRGEKNQIILPFIWVSDQHATIEAADGKIILTDLHSVNGVWLNGKRLLPDHPTVCQDGDKVSFANIVYLVETI